MGTIALWPRLCGTNGQNESFDHPCIDLHPTFLCFGNLSISHTFSATSDRVWQAFFAMNFKAVQDPPSLKLYWAIAVPLAVVTIVLPIIGVRVLRWMITAPRSYVRLLMVLLIDCTALAMYIFLEVSYHDYIINICLAFLFFVWYILFPIVRACAVFSEEDLTLKRLKDRYRVLSRCFNRHDEPLSGTIFFLLNSLSPVPERVRYVYIALFFSYRFYTDWLAYRRLCR